MSYDLFSQIAAFDTKLTMNTLGFLMKCGKSAKYAKGEIVAREGEASDRVYYVVDGAAGVVKTDPMGGKVKIATVEGGGLIGEMGVFLDMTRSATIYAETDLSLIEFTNENFINALPKTPDLTVRLLKSLADKVSRANQTVADSALRAAMLTVGLIILERAGQGDTPEAAITLDLRALREEISMSLDKVHAALKQFQQQDLISPWTIDEAKRCVFTARTASLRAYLKRVVK